MKLWAWIDHDPDTGAERIVTRMIPGTPWAVPFVTLDETVARNVLGPAVKTSEEWGHPTSRLFLFEAIAEDV